MFFFFDSSRLIRWFDYKNVEVSEATDFPADFIEFIEILSELLKSFFFFWAGTYIVSDIHASMLHTKDLYGMVYRTSFHLVTDRSP